MNGQTMSQPQVRTPTEKLAELPGPSSGARPRQLKRRLPFSRRALSLSPAAAPNKKNPTSPPPRRRCQSALFSNDVNVTQTNKILEPLNQGLENAAEQELAEAELWLPEDISFPQKEYNKMLRALIYKKREFIKMRRALISDQNALITAYATIRELEARTNSPHDDGLGDVRIISCSTWPAHDLLLLVRDDLSLPCNAEINSVFGSQVLQQIHMQLSAIPNEVESLADELMARRKDFTEIMKNKRNMALYQVSMDKFTKFFNEFNQETERLNTLIRDTVKNMKSKINYILKLAKIPWYDRDTLKKKADNYKKQNVVLLSKLEELQKSNGQNGAEIQQQKTASTLPQPQRQAEDHSPKSVSKEKVVNEESMALQEELRKERAARDALKNVVCNAESMLRVARARITSLEKQLKDTKSDLSVAKQRHKELEQLYKHRETSLGARSKKLLEVSKTGEMTIEALSLQRDALEMRVKELQEQACVSEKLNATREAEHRSRAESLHAKIQEQEKKKIQAEERVAELEKKVAELEEVIENLRECSNQLFDVERKLCLDMVPNKQNEPTDRETEIWKELQSTRVALTKTEEELRSCRADKENFLNSLSRIAQNGAETLQNKMAAELLEKERKIIKMQYFIQEHKESEKAMKQTLCQYENQVNSLRLEVKRLRNYDCYEKNVSFSDMETELMDLHMQVETLNRERTALVTAAASRALMLERHERAADLFSKMVRTRQNIAKILNNSPESPLSDYPNAETSRSLSSVCATAADTWSALKAERARVLRLESAVLAQGLQLEREARVRTQLERRRSILERAIICAQTNS